MARRGCLVGLMQKKKKVSGCGVAAIIGAAVILGVITLVVFGFYWLFSARKMEVKEKVAMAQSAAVRDSAIASMDEDGRLVYDESDWPVFEPLKPGDAVSRDQFLISTIDDTATELARESFRERADGAPVAWMMKLSDVRAATDGELVADFLISYGIRNRGGGGSYSQLKVVAIFDEDQRESLLNLRRGNWVTVNGTLSLTAKQPRILDANIVIPDVPAPEQ